MTNDDTFCMASSVMHKFTLNNCQPSWFKIAAEGYLLSGNLNDICDHNARVAISFGKTTVIIHLYMCIYNNSNIFLIITILYIYYTAWYSMASSENYVWGSSRIAFKNVANGTQGRYS